MSKYIDEDILLEDLWSNRCESDMLRKVRQAIVDEIIGIEGIEIVHCRECKYWCKGDEVYGICYRCPNTRQMRYDDFCSHGVRKGADDE